MLVCHCKGINDREVRGAIRAGAASCRQIARACGAGSRCGGCHPVLRELLDDSSPSDAPSELHLELSAAR